MNQEKSHIAYGYKNKINKAIEADKIPENCLVVTKPENDGERSELFFYDSNFVAHPIATRNKFTSITSARSWVSRYDCVGDYIVVYENGEWHVYIVNANNEFKPVDGSDKITTIVAADPSIFIGGTDNAPTIRVAIDVEGGNGLDVGETGLKLDHATEDSPGAMSASDKSKLDGIETGAEVNTVRSIETGSANGTISVNGVDVVIKGLGSAAFTDSNDYEPIGAGLRYSVVSELPSTGRSDTVYLILNSGSEDNNIYDEYLYTGTEFELIGTTKTDLSNYYTKSETENYVGDLVTAAVSEKADALELDNYYDKDDVDSIISSGIADYAETLTSEIDQKANTSDLAGVATSGSYNDLSDKPQLPVILNVTKAQDGYYYANITYTTAISLLAAGLQIAIYWPENNMIYQCSIWKEFGTQMFFSVQDNTTLRTIKWSKATDKIEPYSAVSFVTTASMGDYVLRSELDNYVLKSELEDVIIEGI